MPEGAARCDACGWSYVEAEVPESHDLEPPETPTSAPARRVPVTTTRVTGWKRGALQLWVGILVCGLLFGVGACLITMLQNLRL
jgi:rubredoxin